MRVDRIHPFTYNRALLDLADVSGRDLLVVGMSFVDAALEAAIRRTFESVPDDVDKRIFGDRGSAGTLSAKIDLALALGLIPVRLHGDLNLLRRMRNDVAHSFERIDLNLSGTADRIEALQFWRSPGDSGKQAANRSHQDITGPIEWLGRTYDLKDVLLIVDSASYICFVVPGARPGAQPTRPEVVRLSIWAAVWCLVSDVIVEWTNSHPTDEA